MKNLFIIIFILTSFFGFNQTVSQYQFTTSTSASLYDMSSGTSNLGTSGMVGVDDGRSAVTNIGFTFKFCGTDYTQFSVNTNGGMRLGSTQVVTGPNATNFPAATSPLIAPYWGDLAVGASGVGGKVHFKLFGTSPSRYIVVEWKNMEINFGATTGNSTFQAVLYESTNAIEFIYGTMLVGSSGCSCGTSTGGGGTNVRIGIASTNTNNNVITVNQSSFATSLTTTYISNNNSTGNGTATGVNSTSQGSRKRFRFAPPCPAAFTIDGPANPCVGTNQTYTASDGNGSESWSFPSGWTIVSGANSATCVVTVGSNSGTISCSRTSPENCTIFSTNTIPTAPVNGVPSQPSVITGNTSICSTVDNSYSVVNAGVNYTWSYSGTGTLSGSGSSRTLNATTNGTLTCTPSNVCGNGTSRTLGITVNNLATFGTFQYTSGSTQSICSGGTISCSNVISPTAGSGSLGIVWYCGELISGTPGAGGTYGNWVGTINPIINYNIPLSNNLLAAIGGVQESGISLSNYNPLLDFPGKTNFVIIRRAYNSNCGVCVGGCQDQSFYLTINPNPSAPSNPVNYTGCEGSASMSVTSQFIGRINWYTDAGLTNSVNNQTTTSNGQIVTYSPNLTSSQTYYVTRTITTTECRGPATTVTATVSNPPSGLSYTNNGPLSYVTGQEISTNNITITGTLPITYSISSTLPTGLNFNTSSGSISGTPTVISSATDYTITASNNCGNANRILNIAVTNGGLPVELTLFDGIPYPLFNVIKWTTASENNSDYFDLEQSVDGENWKVISNIKAAGNSTTEQKYSFIDNNRNPITYYRLQQFDIDGQFKTYGPIIITKTITDKKVVKYINLLGQEIKPDETSGIVIEIYEDGTMRKMIR